MIDFKKDNTYKAQSKPQIINIPKMLFVMVDGHGAPQGSTTEVTQYQRALEIIYGIVYTIKFWDKKYETPTGFDKFSMPPLESLWWTENNKVFNASKPEDWQWTALHRLPEFVTQDYFNDVVSQLIKQKQTDVYKKARLEFFEEGEVVQILHIGPYSEEQEDINKMHKFATGNGYKVIGKHHELYFGDPRRTAPEKLRTILRQPVQML